MLKSKWVAALCLCAASASAAMSNSQSSMGKMFGTQNREQTIAEQRSRIRSADPEELRAAIDETQGLIGSLAAETGSLDKAALGELFKELRSDYKLPDAEKRARRALELSEEIDQIQSGIKQQQQRLKEAAPEEADKLEERLLGLQSDLLGSVEDLRKTLRSLHKDLDETQLRDLRNWAMVSEGVLRRRREAAEEAAGRQAAAEALPIDAGAVAPAPLSPSAAP